jgi:DtxR family Mn-dependent transcriptional regulator
MARENDNLTRSLEDYLEAIYNLKARSDVARVKDIAFEMDVKMPSVTGALRALAQKGLVKHKPYDAVELTDEGLTRARSVVDRHAAIKRFLVEMLGLPESDAESEACGIEHAIKPETLERLLRFIDGAR